jgi:mRNA interferase RelE/StbE
MQHEVKFTKSALKSYIKLPLRVRNQVNEKLTKLALNPYATSLDIKKLQGRHDSYRLRCGDHRVIYQLENDVMIIHVIRIAHRKEVYQ